MKHKITLTFEYTTDDKTNIKAIRRFLNRTDEFDKTGNEELIVTEGNKCKYVHHDGKFYGSEFECDTLAEFINKYGSINPTVLSHTIDGFAKLTEINATRVEEEEEEDN